MIRLILKCILFMERTGVLIERLLQQYHDNAEANKMLVTVQLLAAELQQQEQANDDTHKNVSVVMPKYITQTVTEEVLDAPKPAVQPAKPSVIEAAKPAEQPKPAPQMVEVVPAPAEAIAAPVAIELPKPEPTVQLQPWQWAQHTPEVPTLTHQPNQPKEKGELNELIGQKSESLNERLKANNVELGSILQSSPVKDLKRAIGINDRYVFINELFKGDEVMYERSIKTINNFTILPEAEYWIRRELKLKLAWNEESESVKHFDQLVKRRFS